MYVYKKKMKKQVYVIMGLSVAIALCTALSLFLVNRNKEAIPIMKEEEIPVITLPDEEEAMILPFEVEATVVKEYFDGSDHEIMDYTLLEGVYRPNQGIDYAFNNESFDVLCMLSGEVVEVKEDTLFGSSITIKSDAVSITYQSLNDVKVKKGDRIPQGSVLAKAYMNSYNPELGNHVHIVICVNGEIVNPKEMIGKRLSEIK